MDFSGNQEKPNIGVSKEQDLSSFTNSLVLGLLTLDKTLKLSFRVFLSLLTNLGESPLLLVELSSTLVKKKPYYKIIPTKEAELKKKIDGDIKKQNIVTGKRIKKWL